jgi:hypothetical protein
MMIRWNRFNINLLLVLALALLCGCQTTESKRNKKLLATLRLYQEVTPDASGRSEVITVHRDPLVMLNIGRAPFLGEGNVQSAKVLDVPGGFALSIQFDHQGSWLLEQYTAASRGRRIAVFSQFMDPPEKKVNQGRWLAAIKINNHITDGLFIFTPDATREEADRIALGLNNVAKKLATGEEIKW